MMMDRRRKLSATTSDNEIVDRIVDASVKKHVVFGRPIGIDGAKTRIIIDGRSNVTVVPDVEVNMTVPKTRAYAVESHCRRRPRIPIGPRRKACDPDSAPGAITPGASAEKFPAWLIIDWIGVILVDDLVVVRIILVPVNVSLNC